MLATLFVRADIQQTLLAAGPMYLRKDSRCNCKQTSVLLLQTQRDHRDTGEPDEQVLAAARILLRLRRERHHPEPEQAEEPDSDEDCDDPQDATWVPCSY